MAGVSRPITSDAGRPRRSSRHGGRHATDASGYGGAMARRVPGASGAAALAAALIVAPALAAEMDPDRVAQDVAIGSSEGEGTRPAKNENARSGVEVVHVHLETLGSVDATGDALSPRSTATSTTMLTRLVVPVPLTEEVAVFGGLTYEAANISIEGTPGATPKGLLELTVGVDAGFAEAWHLTALASGGFFGDAGAPSGDDVRVAGALIVDRRFRDEVTLGAGLAYSSTFSLPIPLPTLILGLHHGDWLEVDVILPAKVEVAVSPTPKIALGVRGAIEGSTWNLDAPPPALVEPLGAAPPERIRLEARTISVGPTAAFRVVGPLLLEAAGGVGFARKLEIVDAENDERSTRIDLAPAPLVRFGLGARL